MDKEFRYINGHWICPKCGSDQVLVHCTYFTDRLTCLKCNYEQHT